MKNNTNIRLSFFYKQLSTLFIKGLFFLRFNKNNWPKISLIIQSDTCMFWILIIPFFFGAIFWALSSFVNHEGTSSIFSSVVVVELACCTRSICADSVSAAIWFLIFFQSLYSKAQFQIHFKNRKEKFKLFFSFSFFIIYNSYEFQLSKLNFSCFLLSNFTFHNKIVVKIKWSIKISFIMLQWVWLL